MYSRITKRTYYNVIGMKTIPNKGYFHNNQCDIPVR